MKYYNYPNTTEVAEDVDTKNADVLLPKELPSTASLENGTYVLKVTKTSSGITLAWVAEEAANSNSET